MAQLRLPEPEPEPEPEPRSREPEARATMMQPATRPVEVTICCERLPLMELTGSSCPVFAVLWLYRRQDRRWQEFGRTEVVWHHDCPHFMRSFQLTYLDNKDVMRWDELDQYIRIELYQHNSSSVNLQQHLRLGKISFALRELFCTPVQRVTLPFGPTTPAGLESCITARIAEVNTAHGAEPVEVAVEVAGLGSLVRRDLCNPFIVMCVRLAPRCAPLAPPALTPSRPPSAGAATRGASGSRSCARRSACWTSSRAGRGWTAACSGAASATPTPTCGSSCGTTTPTASTTCSAPPKRR